MLMKTSKIRNSVATFTLGAFVLASVPGACLASDDPFQDERWRDNRCDMVAVEMATGSSTAAWQPHDTITGEEIEIPPLDDRPGILYRPLPLPPGLG